MVIGAQEQRQTRNEEHVEFQKAKRHFNNEIKQGLQDSKKNTGETQKQCLKKDGKLLSMT